uniref:Coagulation factor V n=1 Tax=Echeneis naucrates TaxID=173247 RepID=A0A665V4S1_ECHNA
MRLCVWAGARGLLPFLLLLSALHVHATQPQPKERHYYIAAVEIDWKYSDSDESLWIAFACSGASSCFPSAGLLGPTLRAEQGETIVVTFRNMAYGAYSIHPHGIAYGKQSEGAYYFDNTSQKEKEDDIVLQNREHVYYWEVTPEVSPQSDDPTCLTYTYISHQNVVGDYNSGLIGALLICKPGSLDESGQQRRVHHEYVFLFGVFDENKSRYKPNSPASDDHVKYTINGYTKGSLPGQSTYMCAHVSVSLHLVGMSSEAEVFSVHMNGQVLQQNGHQVSSVGLISGSTATASMVALYTGRWLLSSYTTKHIEGELSSQKRQSREWKYFIAAEEVIWDYFPTVHQHVDADFNFQYLKQSPTRIGQKYKKVVYTLYNNESFTERAENKQRKNELGILGPVIRAQTRDVIKVVFKNMASRPYSIYPHGLIMSKSNEGVNYPEGAAVYLMSSSVMWLPGNQSHGVQPGQTHTYVWKVSEETEPLDGDSRCLTRMYHSAVNTPRDIASGLIGPILICKSKSLNFKADKEQHAMFAAFDENKSWYLEDNIRLYTDQTKVNRADVDFYRSNIMHSKFEIRYPYSDYDTKNLNLDDAAKYYLKSTDPNIKTYFIAAEEFQWDYGGYGQRRQDKVLQESRETIFTKVIFRRYLDSTFNIPDIRGELDEHLGILGPLIKAEVGQSIVVVFKNNGNRPYSIHPNGVSYTKLTEVQPNSTFTYMWKVNSNVGPSEHESACRTWTYYSGVNPEKDIHSGLIGPLLVCRKGTLTKSPTDVREFMLLFMTFDESQSWYYERNREIIQRKTRRKLLGTNEHFKFHSINGIIFNLKGLRMYTNQLARWHLINMGSPKDVQSIHFHGQTFLNKKTSSYRQAVYPLLPG